MREIIGFTLAGIALILLVWIIVKDVVISRYRNYRDRNTYIHKPSGKEYYKIGEAYEQVNDKWIKTKMIYKNKEGKIFSREISEWYFKFSYKPYYLRDLEKEIKEEKERGDDAWKILI